MNREFVPDFIKFLSNDVKQIPQPMGKFCGVLMFGLSKKKINLIQASSILIKIVLERVNVDWKSDLESLNEVLQTNFNDQDPDLFIDIVLAVIALEYLAVKNMTPQYLDQVVDITISLLANTEDFGEYSKKVMNRYFLPALKKADSENLISTEKIVSMIVTKYCKEPNVLIGMGVSTVIITKCGIWKTIIENYKIAS